MPRTAVAAATSGDTRWVRPPLPCRPSKLRFDVDALRSPGASWSGFMPRHIEQPAERHSAPAAGTPRPGPPARPGAHPHRAGHHQHPHAVGDVPAAQHVGRGPQVLDPAVGARAEEHGVHRDLAQRRCRAPGPCRPAPSRPRPARCSSAISRRVGHPLGQRQPLAGVGAPGDERGERVGVDVHLGVEHRVVVGAQLRASTRPRRPSPRRAGACVAARSGSRRWSRPGRSSRPARRPRSTCCRSSSGLPSTAARWPRRGTRARNPGRRRCRSGRSPPG